MFEEFQIRSVMWLTRRVNPMTDRRKIFRRILTVFFMLQTIGFGARALDQDLMQGDGVFLEPTLFVQTQCFFPKNANGSSCPVLDNFSLSAMANFENWDLALGWRVYNYEKRTWSNSDRLLGLSRRLDPSLLSDMSIGYRLSRISTISLENWHGSSILPSAEGLAFSNFLLDSDISQPALRVRLQIPDQNTLSLDIVAGSGKFQNFSEHASLSYKSLLLRWHSQEYLEWVASWSKDSASDLLLSKQDEGDFDDTFQHRNFHTRMLSFAVSLNGRHVNLRGLKLSLGTQLNKTQSQHSSESAPIKALSLKNLDFVSGARHLLRSGESFRSQVWSLSGSYRILDTYIIAFQSTELSVESPSRSIFAVCSTKSSDLECDGEEFEFSNLRVRQNVLGLGQDLHNGFRYFFESINVDLDRRYQNFSFSDSEFDRSVRAYQIRLAYDLQSSDGPSFFVKI